MAKLGRGTFFAIVSTGLMAACQAGVDGTASVATSTKREALRWDTSDNPSIFSDDLVYTLSNLPSQGQVTSIPWPGSYWPTYLDSVDYRWAGEGVESPAEKYGKAFELTDMSTQVSTYTGILSQDGRTACSTDSECNSSLGEVCAKRRGNTQGYCIPTWFGLCHAWAPAAILEPEPLREVTRNGVTFKVNDLKALMTLAYDQSTARLVSRRCNESNSAGEIAYDAYGRPVDADAECRDTNPGTFHLIAANYLGLKQLAMVEDRIFDDQVWNQPVRGFEVVDQVEVSAREANRLVGAVGQTVTKTGVVVQSAWAHLGSYPVRSGQQISITMSGLGDADLYVRFGAQPTTSKYACRPYEKGSNETCKLAVPQGETQVFVSVRGYALMSTYTVNMVLGDGGLETYRFDADAVRFYYVKTNLSYIYESGIAEDGNLRGRIDDFTGTDTYEYVLELDRDNKIIGGEWLNQSKTNHPDFLWVPTGHGNNSGSPVDYATVKSLLDESVKLREGEHAVSVRKSGTVAQGEWTNYGPFEATSGTFRAVMTGTGDADLYVRRGSAPTGDAFDCRPYLDGSSETCDLDGSGPIYVSVAGYAATSDFTLDLSYIGTSE